MDGDAESVIETLPDMLPNRDEMELEVWCKDKNENSFVAVTRPVFWQDFAKNQEDTIQEFNIYNKNN